MANIFQRKEIKYLIDSEQREYMEDTISERLSCDGLYAHAHIESLYYDTPDWTLALRSLDKPIYKEKFRIRRYAGSEQMFYEIKKKYKGIVYKRRIPLEAGDFDNAVCALPNILTEQSDRRYCLSAQESQIKDEIAYMFSHYDGLSPALLIEYDRLAYEPRINETGNLLFPADMGLRITFDTSPMWSSEHYGMQSQKMIDDDMSIMEIKVSGSFPLWLSHILSEGRIYPHSFTKYGTAYTALA